jgi:hypothetical protein
VSPRPDDHQAGNHVHCAAVSDGTTAILFEPSEFLERLAALVPRPEKNLLIYRGLLAPNHKLRSLVVRFNRKQWSLDAPSVISTTPDVISNEASVICPSPASSGSPVTVPPATATNNPAGGSTIPGLP